MLLREDESGLLMANLWYNSEPKYDIEEQKIASVLLEQWQA